jgi:hypothetical protein
LVGTHVELVDPCGYYKGMVTLKQLGRIVGNKGRGVSLLKNKGVIEGNDFS